MCRVNDAVYSWGPPDGFFAPDGALLAVFTAQTSYPGVGYGVWILAVFTVGCVAVLGVLGLVLHGSTPEQRGPLVRAVAELFRAVAEPFRRRR